MAKRKESQKKAKKFWGMGRGKRRTSDIDSQQKKTKKKMPRLAFGCGEMGEKKPWERGGHKPPVGEGNTPHRKWAGRPFAKDEKRIAPLKKEKVQKTLQERASPYSSKKRVGPAFGFT